MSLSSAIQNSIEDMQELIREEILEAHVIFKGKLVKDDMGNWVTKEQFIQDKIDLATNYS